MGWCEAVRYEGGGVMTTGEAAYREDVRRQPTYPWSDEPRRSWEALEPEIKANWEKNPTPRVWGKAKGK